MLVVGQSFSKSFLMTGWRPGLAGAAAAAGIDAAGQAAGVQQFLRARVRAARRLAALALPDDFVPALVGRLKAGRDRLLAGLQALPGVTVAVPPGGMYAFFRVDGQDDSLAFAKRLVSGYGLGIAPGAAFGDEGEGWLRWCFATRDLQRLDDGLTRLRAAISL